MTNLKSLVAQVIRSARAIFLKLTHYLVLDMKETMLNPFLLWFEVKYEYLMTALFPDFSIFTLATKAQSKWKLVCKLDRDIVTDYSQKNRSTGAIFGSYRTYFTRPHVSYFTKYYYKLYIECWQLYSIWENKSLMNLPNKNYSTATPR